MTAPPTAHPGSSEVWTARGPAFFASRWHPCADRFPVVDSEDGTPVGYDPFVNLPSD